MRRTQRLDFDHCTVLQASYESGLYMPPHTDKESEISIVPDGQLLEKVPGVCVEARRNCVVIKPNHAVHEDLSGPKGARLLTVNFKNGYTIPGDLCDWGWFEDPRLSFSTYKLWYSLKSVKNDKALNGYLGEFLQ